MSARNSERAQGYPSVTLAIKVCLALDAAYTQEKLAEANLGGLFDSVVEPHKKFEIKHALTKKSQRKFVIKAAPTAETESNSAISNVAPSGLRIDTLKGSASGAPLYIDRSALQTIRDHINWAKRTQENCVEQGGLIIGEIVRTKSQKQIVLVTRALPARGTRGSRAYVKFDHVVWKQMYDELDELVRTGAITGKQTVIGWYHTHPNMGVFMSGTDMRTQRSLFNQEWNYALVLNPQDKLCGCFRGEDATPAPLIETDIISDSPSPQGAISKQA